MGNLRSPLARAPSSYRGRETGRDIYLVNGPAGDRCLSAAAVPDIEVGNCEAESRADALDVCLFAGPALKESRQAAGWRQRRQRTLLGWRHEPCHDAVDVRDRLDRLDVYADVHPPTGGIEGNVCGPGGAEKQVRARESRLPTIAADHRYVAWDTAQLACKQVAQPSSGGKETSSVQWAVKAICTLSLIR